MWGGPAHQDTWDLKPNAPAEIRGEFKPIATKVPGISYLRTLAATGPAHRPIGDRALDDAYGRQSSDLHAFSADRPAAAGRRRACAATGRTSARCCRGSGAGAIRCRRSSRCGPSSTTTCRDSSSNATVSPPAGWARLSIRSRSTRIRRSPIIASATLTCRQRSRWRDSTAAGPCWPT